ncbi:Retrovirus-related Pol polyprotein from type-1 retrotransposable element R1 [Araneus ventricosus]|uniref:Retrovirus-related Pol polyprotein from type-1 retrotransposable element R1 n=1 Tax=Araneus ventricosus TaxID=182803 RepID=A0A4Y2IVM2_ARAVE|nr:Retrovirus-related Pol polyprotein from type-1 retrotransposable element R1 [Araneus ventricosus]
MIQEPYSRRGKVYGLPINWRIISAPQGKTLIAISNKTIGVNIKHLGKHVVAIEISNNNEDFNLVSVYFPPSLSKEAAAKELEEVIIKIGHSKIVIGGDVNVRSSLWSPEGEDHRPQDEGGPLIDLILKYNLLVLNDPSSPPTFESRMGSSWIDVTLASLSLHDWITDWKVVLAGVSDHNYIFFKITNNVVPIPQMSSHLSRRKLQKLSSIVQASFANAEAQMINIKSRSALENWVTKLTNIINSALKVTQPKTHKTLRVPWWDMELEVQRKKTRALRSRYNRCKNQTERQIRRTLYKKNEAKYKWLIKTKSRACFEKLCVELTQSNPFSLPYKLATNKLKKPLVLSNVKRPDGTPTTTLKETVEVIVKTLFPKDEINSETTMHKTTRECVNSYKNDKLDPEFTNQEIMSVIKIMARRKAPGLDNITTEIVEEVHKKSPFILRIIFNKCLQLGSFPRAWKTAKLVLINKPDKDPEIPKSYRPICLISVIGKVLDKLLPQRITHLLVTRNMLHPNQHGFRKEKSCETANYALWKTINSALKSRQKIAIVSLDVSGAFDSVWRPSVLQQLTKAECPGNIYNLVNDYLQNRKIEFHYNNKIWKFDTERGVPQGSCSGPLYWNMVADTALKLRLPRGCSLQAFADDLLLVIKAKDKTTLVSNGNTALNRLVEWGKFHKLSFNAAKTVLMPITFGGSLNPQDPLSVELDGEIINAQRHLKYLGVIWDSSLTFTEHFQQVRKKADLLIYRISTVAERFYWRHQSKFRRVYNGAFEPFVLYGYGAWGPRLGVLAKLRNTLNIIQRRPLVKLTNAYKTTSTAALQVLAGTLPLDLRAKEVYDKFRLTTAKQNNVCNGITLRWNSFEGRQNIFDKHPVNWVSIPYGKEDHTQEDIEIYTDGSKLDNQTGTAMVVYYHGTLIHHEIHRLPDYATVYQAELMGIKMALQYVEKSANWHKFHIFTDSLSSLQALANTHCSIPSLWDIKDIYDRIIKIKWLRLHWIKAHVGNTGNEAADAFAKEATKLPQVDVSSLQSRGTIKRTIRTAMLADWQRKWTDGSKGRQTEKYIKEVKIHKVIYNKFVVQFLTGHGRFPYYFCRFGITTNPNCRCGMNGDADHYIHQCKNTLNLRNKLIFDSNRPETLLHKQQNLGVVKDIVSWVNEDIPQI